jgi:hypothetical protein
MPEGARSPQRIRRPKPNLPNSRKKLQIVLGSKRGLGSPAARGDGVIPLMPWSARFDDPIPLPRGRQLVTLEDAGKYITKLPKAEHEATECGE